MRDVRGSLKPEDRDQQLGPTAEDAGGDRLQSMRMMAHRQKIHRSALEGAGPRTATVFADDEAGVGAETVGDRDQQNEKDKARVDDLLSELGDAGGGYHEADTIVVRDLRRTTDRLKQSQVDSTATALRGEHWLRAFEDRTLQSMDGIFAGLAQNPNQPVAALEESLGCPGLIRAANNPDHPFYVAMQAKLMGARAEFQQQLTGTVGELGSAPLNGIEAIDRRFMRDFYHHALFGVNGAAPLAVLVRSQYLTVQQARQRFFQSHRSVDPGKEAMTEELNAAQHHLDMQAIDTARNLVDLVYDMSANAIGNAIGGPVGNFIGNRLHTLLMRRIDLKALKAKLQLLKDAPQQMPPDELSAIAEEFAKLTDLDETVAAELKEESMAKGLFGESAADKRAEARGEGGILGQLGDKVADGAGMAEDMVTAIGIAKGTGDGHPIDAILDQLATVSQAAKAVSLADSVARWVQLGLHRDDVKMGIEQGTGKEHGVRQQSSADLVEMGYIDPQKGVVYRRVSESDPNTVEEDVIRAPMEDAAAGA